MAGRRLAVTVRFLLAGTPLLAFLPGSVDAQGVGFSVTPTVEEARWGEDLLIENTIFPGALLSAQFGRFVALDSHYFRSRSLEVEGSPTTVVASRWGGDVRFVLSPSALAPFVRVGAGVLEFEPDSADATRSRHLTASFGGGLRFELRGRVRGELSARRLSFRAGPGSGVVEDDGSPEPQRDIDSYAFGLGVQIPLGGTWDDPNTDEEVQSLGLVAIPVRVFAGSLRFAEALALDAHPVVGAVLGADFGPFVGGGLYAFGSARDGLGSPDLLYGYGFEGSFNLVRRGAAFTPHLLLGGGRMHFTEEDRITAALDARKKWTATVGGGIDFAITERVRGEVTARNLVLSQRATDDVSSPAELRGSWLFSGGLRLVLGGGRRQEADRTTLSTPITRTPSRVDEVVVTPRTRATADDVAALELERDRLIRELEVERLQQALDRLRNEGDATAAERLLAEYLGETPAPATPRSFEVPVLEQGEFRVRFGPEGATDTTRAQEAVGAAAAAGTPQPTVQAPDDPRVDRLLESVARLEGRLETLLSERERAPETPQTVQVDVSGAGATRPTVAVETAPSAPRGVLRGETPGLKGFGFFTGARLEPVGQALLGVEADVGSAFGGGIRLRPDLTVGVTEGFTWGMNAHLAWPTPVRFWGLRPELGAGAGIFREGSITRVMIPNVSVALTREVGSRLEGFLSYQALDLFDDHRLVAGVRLRPRPEAPRTGVSVGITGSGPLGSGSSSIDAAPAATTDSAALREQEELRRTMSELRTEVESLRNELSAAEAAAQEAARRAASAEESRSAPAPAPAPTPAPEPREVSLLDRLEPLERLESVERVRRVARGVSIVLGGGRTFGVGASALSELAHAEIASIAALLVDGTDPVSVEGHTDSTGGAEANLRLSELRAEAVRAALLAHGIAASRTSVVGFGATRPLAGNGTAEGRATNRRVEIVVLTEPPTGSE